MWYTEIPSEEVDLWQVIPMVQHEHTSHVEVLSVSLFLVFGGRKHHGEKVKSRRFTEVPTKSELSGGRQSGVTPHPAQSQIPKYFALGCAACRARQRLLYFYT